MSKKFVTAFLALSISLITLCHNSFADQVNPYTVDGVSASAKSKSAGDAKTVAIANARRDAFLITLTRLSLPINIADNVTNDDIFDMVMSEQITEEKIAGNNYSAIFNITFAKEAVNRVLQEKNVKKEEVKQDVFLLIPIKNIKYKTLVKPTGKIPEKFLLWEDDNDWRVAIAKSLKEKSLRNFIIPENNIDNIAILSGTIEQIEYSQIEPLLAKYNATAAYAVTFLYDDIENKVSIKVQNIRKLQKKQTKLGFVNIERLGYEALVKKVSEKTLEYLSSTQSENNAKPDSIDIVKIEIPISGLDNYMVIKSKIEATNLISQMSIESISKDYVKLSVSYVNSGVDIVDAFAKFGLILRKKSDNSYSLTEGNMLDKF